METHLIIPLEGFPEEGLMLRGEVDSRILGLEEGSAHAAGPIAYELEATLYDTELVVRGSLSVPLRMRCDRCLEEFDYELDPGEVSFSFEVQDAPALDITDSVREELILALPAYPKCELIGKECQIHDIFDDFRLDKVPPSGVDCATPSGEGVWDALDKISGVQRP